MLSVAVIARFAVLYFLDIHDPARPTSRGCAWRFLSHRMPARVLVDDSGAHRGGNIQVSKKVMYGGIQQKKRDVLGSGSSEGQRGFFQRGVKFLDSVAVISLTEGNLPSPVQRPADNVSEKVSGRRKRSTMRAASEGIEQDATTRHNRRGSVSGGR